MRPRAGHPRETRTPRHPSNCRSTSLVGILQVSPDSSLWARHQIIHPRCPVCKQIEPRLPASIKECFMCQDIKLRGIGKSFVCALLVMSASGCFDSSAPTRVGVYGTVKLDGTPVPEGTISFIPEQATNGPTAGGQIVQGAYKITSLGPAIGKYRVEIKSMRKTGKKIEAGTPAPPGTMIDEIEQYIPAKYNTNSELVFEFERGDNEVDFDLTSK